MRLRAIGEDLRGQAGRGPAVPWQAEAIRECEADAQTNVNMFTSGTWDTNDYIAQWTNPCPLGTSIVPNSQFYVANSCNPLPNVGVGCAGDGSFNYEFQVGVMCQ